MKQALADGNMDVVNKILVKDGKKDLTSTAKIIYFTQGSDAKVNFESLTSMKVFLDYTANNREMKQALADGKLDVANKVLIKDGKGHLNDVAQKVFVAEGRHAQVNVINHADMKVIASFASENGDFARAMRDGKLDRAAKIALTAGKNDISLYNLKSATYILGNNKNFASDLNRVAAVVAMPTYRVAVDHPGWSRLISISNEASWKQTVNAVKDGKVQLQ